MPLSPTVARNRIRDFKFRELFVQELGWDRPAGAAVDVPLDGHVYRFTGVAQKRGFRVFECVAPADAYPDYAARARLDRQLGKAAFEHLVIYTDPARTRQTWVAVRQEAGAPPRLREDAYAKGDTGERLVQKLQLLAFTLDEEDALTLTDIRARTRAAFDVERVTKRFFDRFQEMHAEFVKFIEGLADASDRAWYASLMMNRLMFAYFIQKKGFLDNNPDYLRDKLKQVQTQRGKDEFDAFYRHFLMRLFQEGLGRKRADRARELDKLLGDVPYLNGGLFDLHELEAAHAGIRVPDEAFEKLFDFFDGYRWHLDERPLRADNEINPDVLGYIFEKYINQKQMGAYYTKEDITGYITRNSLLPFVLCRVAELCAVAFQPGGSVWRLLSDDPDRYIYPAVRHGCEPELPADISAGVADVGRRGGWNRPAADGFGLPTETWRECVARRERCYALRGRLAAGNVTTVNDLVTLNLDVVRFTTDMVVECEGPELLRAVWQTLTTVSVLDPTCGSGAFLFAALTILEPLYDACLDRMQVFVDDAKRADPATAGERYKDFREVLADVALHPSRRYFVLKTVVVNNLFGVDVMAEAVEICKLRLFPKLVAQVDRAQDLEPLPDIDFNVRAGNTLVGFATLAEARTAVDVLNYQELEGIRADAERLDGLFRLFRSYQTGLQDGQLPLDFTKQTLRDSLDAMRDRLDRFLAEAYGVAEGDPAAFAAWRASHQPFHWWVEFHGTMTRGGFDVIVGNPPYIQLSEVEGYRPLGYSTTPCGNLYALALERCSKLARPESRQGYIVPVSSISTDGYISLQRILRERALWHSSFDDRPSRLFDGIEHIRLTIHLLGPTAAKPLLTSSRYNKWNRNERGSLFERLALTPTLAPVELGALPKLCHPDESDILAKMTRQGQTLETATVRSAGSAIYYSRKLGYFVQVLDFKPEVHDQRGQLRDPSEFKEVRLATKQEADAALCCLNSTLFYWFVTVFSDCRHLNKREVSHLPVDVTALASGKHGPQLTRLASELMISLRVTSERRVMKSSSGTLTVQCIIAKHSKPIIDRIDAVLAAHYGFTPEELDFVQNYDIKYRLGADAAADGGED